MAGINKPVFISAFAGVRNDLDPKAMTFASKKAATDLVAGANVDIDDTGGMARRDGFTQLQAGTGMHSLFSSSDGQHVLVVQGDGLYRVTANGTGLQTLALGLTAGLQMRYWEHQGSIYHMNGAESGVYRGGVVGSWGLNRPQNPSLTATAGQLSPGQYAVALTYYDALGNESGAGAGTAIDLPSGGGIAVTITASSQAAAVGVYCTAPDGATLYRVARVANQNGQYLIAIASTQLSAPLVTHHYDVPPVGHLLAFYRGRAYVAVGQRLQFSSAFGVDLFRPTDYIAFATPISMLSPVTDGIYVSDETGTYWLSGVGPESFTQSRVGEPAVAGTVAYSRGILIGDSPTTTELPVWLSKDGVCVGMNGGQVMVANRKWRPENATSGAGLVRQAGETFQYLVSIGD